METREVYEEIKKRILRGIYQPGSVLVEKEIADEFGISRTPVRLIMVRLEAVGLVRIVPHRGIYVAEMTLQLFRDLFEVRKCLIGLSGRLAAERICPEELHKLSLLADRAKEEKDRTRLQELDMEFHELLDRSTQNTILAETLEVLRNQMTRIWSIVHVNIDYFLCLPDELKAVVAALQARDSDECERLLSEHIEHYRRYVNT